MQESISYSRTVGRLHFARALFLVVDRAQSELLSLDLQPGQCERHASVCSMQWRVWKDSNLQCSKRAPGLRPGRASQSPQHTQHSGGEGASRTRKSQRHAPLQTGSACHMPNLSITPGGSGASRTRKPRRYVPLRTGWAFPMPNATLHPSDEDLSPGTPVPGGRNRT